MFSPSKIRDNANEDNIFLILITGQNSNEIKEIFNQLHLKSVMEPDREPHYNAGYDGKASYSYTYMKTLQNGATFGYTYGAKPGFQPAENADIIIFTPNISAETQEKYHESAKKACRFITYNKEEMSMDDLVDLLTTKPVQGMRHTS